MTDPRAVAERVAVELAGQGARAVALVGSHASGEASADSDIDLAVVGDGPRYRLEIHNGFLVSIGWASEEEQRRRLYDPSILAMHVPGWRAAVPLHDHQGLAVSIAEEADKWSWDRVEPECSTWAAAGIADYVEEVHKLVTGLRRGRRTTAAIQRSLLAVHLAHLVAVRRHILYGSENVLWDRVAGELGSAWRSAQDAALGLGGESLEASCHAALVLFEFAVDEVRPMLDARQVALVERALETARVARLLR